MIKQENAKSEIRGTKLNVMSELTSLINTIYQDDVLTKDEISECVRVAMLDKEDLENEVKSAFFNVLKAIFGVDGGEKSDPS